MMNASSSCQYGGRLGTFVKNEEGAGTAFGLFMFVLLAAVLGLGLDFSNAWRNRTYLSSSADMAVHAAAVEMANGGTTSDITTAIQDSVTWNMPTNMFGNVLDTNTDITFADYDIWDREFDSLSSTDPNAVVVEVYRNQGRGNPVASYLLQLIGMDTLHVEAVSAAVFDMNGVCDNTDGIYARDTVTLTSQSDVGAGFCIHSETDVWLPQQNTFQDGSMVTMPDLADCKNKCTDSANPGIYAVESHMILPDFGSMIASTYSAFDGPIGVAGDKYDFFHNDPTDPYDPVISLGSTTALEALLGIAAPALGDVITMSQSEFESMPNLPSGLVYKVDCPNNGNGPNTKITFDGSSAKMDGSVLLTDCSLEFDSGAEVVSSVVITTRESSNATITADSNVVIGDPSASCGATERSYIMSASKVSVPAKFGLSNVTMVVDDDVNIASSSSHGDTSWGFSIYATGEVHVSSQHTFRTCGNKGEFMVPEPKVIRLVVPPAI